MSSLPPKREIPAGAYSLLFSGIFWLCVWQAVYMKVGISLLVPSPAETVGVLLGLLGTAAFRTAVAASVISVMGGFLMGVTFGALLGGLAARFKAVEYALALPVGIIKTTPLASFILLVLVWVRRSRITALISFLMMFPTVYAAVYDGVRSADPKLAEVARVYNFSAYKTFRTLVVPAVLPFFVSALRSSVGIAWKAGISGEVLAVMRGTIGGELYNAKTYLDTPGIFAWTVVIIAISLFTEYAVLKLTGKFYASRTQSETHSESGWEDE